MSVYRETFTDGQRRRLVRLALEAMPDDVGDAELTEIIARLSGSDTVLVAFRIYPSRATVHQRYIDPSCPERACDRCGELYRGPAVYCSFDCALADA